MRHFVQYHNPTTMGDYRSTVGDFGIETRKPVAAIGDRMWLITRSRSAAVYWLCETFIANHFRTERGGRILISAVNGQALRSVDGRIDDKPWFGALRRTT